MLYFIFTILVAAAIGGFAYWNRTRALLHTLNIAELIPDALLIIDEEGNIKSANRNAEVLFGYTKKELYALTVEDLMPERFRKIHKKQRKHFNKSPDVRPMGMGRDLFILKKDGTEAPAEIALSPATDYCIFDNRYHTIVLLHDITQRKEVEKEINHLAYFDQLTNIPNRTSFYIESPKIIKKVERRNGNLAFVMVDIRELKKINDTLGHFAGDDVIQKTGYILKPFAYDYTTDDIKRSHLYKISGNEFLFLLEYDCSHHGYCDVVDNFAEEILDKFKETIKMDGIMFDVQININIGVSIMPAHGISSSQLLKTADIALVKSKQMGKNNYCYYNNTLDLEFENFTMYENAIKYFIKTQDFDIAFQPVWSNERNRFIGSEVLFRCNELKYPDMRVDFLINVAESTGLIVPLGSAILEKACEEGKEHDLICNDSVVSVNASIQQVEEQDFATSVIDILKRTDFNPNNLAIEVTETTLMHSEEKVVKKIKELREHGIRIYIDDFGKGFSSLAYLNKLPADKLKIDMSFLENINNKSSVEILRGIIELGHAIEMIVCSEGVETERQFELLKELGCDEIQGYFISKPVSGDELKVHYPEMFINCDKTDL